MDNLGRRFSVLDNCQVTVAAHMSDSPIAEDFTVTQKYVNYTTHLIDIKTRVGMNVELKPVTQLDREERVEIQIDWRMSGEAFRKCVDDLVAKTYKSGSLTGMIVRAIDERYQMQSRNNQVSACVIVKVFWKDIIAAGGVVYLEELDVLIAVGETYNKPIDHPFSPNERVRASLGESIPHLGKDTFVMSIKAVDNNPLRKYQDRFVLVGDTVHHIPIEVDKDLQTGIHITTRVSAEQKNARGCDGGVITEFLTFETADERYGFADTIDKAKAGGTWESVYKEKLAARAYEQKVREHDIRDKALDREEQLNNARHQQQQEKSRDDLKKEETRNFADWMKLVASTIAATLSLTGLIAKLKFT